MRAGVAGRQACGQGLGEQLQAPGISTSPGLGLIMGADFPVLAANLARSLLGDRVGVLMAVFEAA